MPTKLLDILERDMPVKSIRVLHVVASMDPNMGGVSKAVEMIIYGLKDFHVQGEVVSLDPPDFSLISGDSIPIHPLGAGKNPWKYSRKFSGCS